MVDIKVSYTVRRSDFVLMYLGSWAARCTLVPGLLSVAIGIPYVNPQGPIGTNMTFIAFGIFLMVVGPLALCWLLMGAYGSSKVVGSTVHLRIAGHGLSGWPLYPHMDRSWPRIRRARSFGGVIALPFRQFGTRAGWVPVPERAFSTEELKAFRALLKSKNLLKSWPVASALNNRGGLFVQQLGRGISCVTRSMARQLRLWTRFCRGPRRVDWHFGRFRAAPILERRREAASAE